MKHLKPAFDDAEARQVIQVSAWQPEADPLRNAVLGKLLEELGEAVAITARCQIQGIGGAEPVTGALNRVELENELADVVAQIEVAVEFFDLNGGRMNERVEKKKERMRQWHSLIRPDGHAFDRGWEAAAEKILSTATALGLDVERPAVVNVEDALLAVLNRAEQRSAACLWCDFTVPYVNGDEASRLASWESAKAHDLVCEGRPRQAR